jgi:hypothetical protein
MKDDVRLADLFVTASMNLIEVLFLAEAIRWFTTGYLSAREVNPIRHQQAHLRPPNVV